MPNILSLGPIISGAQSPSPPSPWQVVQIVKTNLPLLATSPQVAPKVTGGGVVVATGGGVVVVVGGVVVVVVGGVVVVVTGGAVVVAAGGLHDIIKTRDAAIIPIARPMMPDLTLIFITMLRLNLTTRHFPNGLKYNYKWF